MTEREHCEAAAVAFYTQDSRRRPRGPSLVDIIERERAAAWLEGRNAGLDAAKRAFDGITAHRAPLLEIADALAKAVELAGAEAEHRDGCYGGTDDAEPCICGTRALGEALAAYLEKRSER